MVYAEKGWGSTPTHWMTGYTDITDVHIGGYAVCLKFSFNSRQLMVTQLCNYMKTWATQRTVGNLLVLKLTKKTSLAYQKRTSVDNLLT